MENSIVNNSVDVNYQNPMAIDGMPSSMFPGMVIHQDSLLVNSRNQIMAGYPLLSALQGEPINVRNDLHVANHDEVNSNASVSRNLPLDEHGIGDSSPIISQSIDNNEFQGQFMGGASLTATSLFNFLAANGSLQEDLNRISISSNSSFPLKDLRSTVSNGCCDTSNSSLTASVNCGYTGENDYVQCIVSKKDTGVTDQLDGKWTVHKFPGPEDIAGKALPHGFVGSLDPHVWMSSNKSSISADDTYGYCLPSNELSLSLATCQPSIISVPTITDQCSEISSSVVTQHSLHEVGMGVGFGSEQASRKSNELSLGFGSYAPVQFSQILSESKYLNVAQQILSEFASYSLKNLGCLSYSAGEIGTGQKIPLSSNFSAEREIQKMRSDEFPLHSGETGSNSQKKLPLQRQEVEARKTQLLALLQVVDSRYSQCLDEIHTVVSAFHAATEMDPRIHACFVLQTISFLYSNLRERIANQILASGEHLSIKCMVGEKFKSSFIQKQWALQQLRRRDHQSWRPQRGLPERSVSVLRAWMFQNFLHPYPKDTEKHLLAIRSGLTRSQVSNWFINARVRLWKPMIEEMYSEMNNRRGRRTDDATENGHRTP
ncbi:PREDICTED: uncharacterized protein LOC104604402 [Nelumbo nucifera]|uniref:Uncharacterized protein LOC104604402 n=2 Tax=Nelumbo nucifera TaxID=4432 RepID=A0A1U8AUX7_NELNU|nr:PREDICTED: uncharacterized protein LOC104604402 [Nelumbo nucifera]XP_010267006.1 PREDICTED: uncharacterized protein LOC104604402 [Nelumbo nucifera]XP_010267007.1 PREDICTED: uncharacterized protein LOC104604402 [Nelumbo nucifera]XP_010267008.1 PREDICTED: uncharacterized protein LOC104604402 [Nelumbo nucifera]DAD48951.1 TPA_asm: hypothetical protein HUJ06_018888 [Nelumbo nucifera]